MFEKRLTRREVVKKAVYLTPVILTLPAVLSFSSAGSGSDGGHGGNEGNENGLGGRRGGFSCNFPPR